MKKEKPKIACLPNGPYYLLNDLTPKVIPNIQKSDGQTVLHDNRRRLVSLWRIQQQAFLRRHSWQEWILGQEADRWSVEQSGSITPGRRSPFMTTGVSAPMPDSAPTTSPRCSS